MEDNQYGSKMNKHALRITDLTAGYGEDTAVLQGISLSLEKVPLSFKVSASLWKRGRSYA